MIKRNAIIALSSVFLLSACSWGPKQTDGTIIGGVGGTIIGAAIGAGASSASGAAVAGGAIGLVAGGVIGNVIGHHLDKK